MKKYIAASTEIENQLKDLVDDIVWQEYDNEGKYAEVEFELIYDSVVSHVEAIVFEMDDDGIYADLAEELESDPSKYMKLMRQYTEDCIDNYPWTVIWN